MLLLENLKYQIIKSMPIQAKFTEKAEEFYICNKRCNNSRICLKM